MSIWRTIPGIPTHDVSADGKVRAKARSISVLAGAKKHRRILPAKLITLIATTHKGKPHYVTVTIRHKTYLLHRLIALAFLGDAWFAGAEINHKNGDKQDNSLGNLEWVTRSQNELHSYRVLGKGKRKP